MQTFSGSCHCGAVRFEVTSDLSEAGECNCSICTRVGWIMVSVKPSQFRQLSGGNAQTDYQFGKKTMHHLFCSTCGVHSFGRYGVGKDEKVIVNVRCLKDVDPSALKIGHVDGKSY
jgi:hypothetical protein